MDQHKTTPTQNEIFDVETQNVESNSPPKRSKRALSRPENPSKKQKNSKISTTNSEALTDHFLLYEQNFDEFFQDIEVKKIMIEEQKTKEQIKTHLKNKKTIAQKKKDSNDGNQKGKNYRDNLVANGYSLDAENYCPSDEEPVNLTQTEEELISKDLNDTNSSISSDSSLSVVSDTFSTKKKLRQLALQSTKNLKEAQVEEIRMHRQHQNEKSETNNFFKLFLVQQLQKLNDTQTSNNTEKNIRDIKVGSEKINSKYLIQVSKNDTLELVLQKFNFLVKEIHTSIQTIDGYAIISADQLKEGEQYIFK